MKSYKFVNYLWDDAKAASLDPVGRLIYRSNLLGSDQRITNTGGGNTSAKISCVSFSQLAEAAIAMIAFGCM